MKKVKGKEISILLMFQCCFFLITCLFLYIYNQISYKEFTREVNKWTSSVIAQIEEKYPDIGEEELIQLLNSKEGESELLKKLGINDDNIAILSLEKRKNRTFLVGFCSISLLEIMVILFLVIDHNRKNKAINKMVNHVKELNKKNYILEIAENEESELSILQNELYKITVMLKEESEQSKLEKESLRKSVEDISHQLKTPLTSIRILLDSIEETEMDKKTQMEFLHDISNQIENMNFLTITLLKLARFDAGVIVMKKEEIHLSQLFLDVQKDLAVLLELKNQKLIIDNDKDIKLIGDYHWLEEAITNIVKNCSEHSSTNETIEIHTKETPFYIKIEIIDHGEGIPSKDIKHIFDRFYKSSNASHDSIGIGLSLAKTIIEKNNGYITCKSEEGVGTAFILKFAKK